MCIKNVKLYEFVCMNLYKKKRKKKRKLGFQPGTNMACNRRSGTPSTPPPHLSVPILFIYRTIRRPSEKTDYTISPVWHSQPQNRPEPLELGTP